MMKTGHRIVVVAGPTAVGKTRCAIGLAKAFNGEIVSCDSMQIYKYMDIGSAKPSREDLEEVPHHLIGVVDPRERFSAAIYKEMAENAMEEILGRGKLPIICGGTGLYLDAVLRNLDFGTTPEEDEAYRKSLYEIAEKEGAEALHRRLESLDPEAAGRIHANNVKRVVRAIEAAEKGEGLKDFTVSDERNPRWDPLLIGLTMNREELYSGIDERVDILVEMGLEKEVKGLMDMGLTEEDYSMKGIGYKELIPYLKGEYDLERAVYLIKRNSRHYAKRQMTWFKRYEDMNWFNLSEYESGERAMQEIIQWMKKEL